jgi:hypothetical protein
MTQILQASAIVLVKNGRRLRAARALHAHLRTTGTSLALDISCRNIQGSPHTAEELHRLLGLGGTA